MIDPFLELGYWLFGVLGVVAYHKDIDRLLNVLVYGGGQSLTDLTKHTYIDGTIGSGKTTYLYNRFLQTIEKHGAVIISTHGLKDLLKLIPKKHVDRVVVISPARERPRGINLLQRHTNKPTEKYVLADNLVSILRKLDHTIGGNMEELIYQATLAILEAQELMPDRYGSVSIYEIYLFLSDEEYRTNVLYDIGKTLNQTIIHTFENPNSESLQASIRRMRRLVGNPILLGALAHPEPINLFEVVEKGQILVCDLEDSPHELGELAAEMIAECLIAKLYIIATSRSNRSKHYFAFFDEFQRYVTDSIVRFIEEGRKRNFPIMLAHQRQGQLTKNQSEAVRLCGTWYVFQVVTEDAKKLSEALPDGCLQSLVSKLITSKKPPETWRLIARLPDYTAVYREKRGKSTFYGKKKMPRPAKEQGHEAEIWARNSEGPTRDEIVQSVTKGGTTWLSETKPCWTSLESFVVPPTNNWQPSFLEAHLDTLSGE